MTEWKTVDCRGLACPQPVTHTKEALRDARAPFQVIVNTEASCTNVRRFAESQGAKVELAKQAGEFHLTIAPGHQEPANEEPAIACSTTGAESMVVFVSSEGMGRGDDELGGVLMEAFLDTLSQFRGKISHAIFVNAGAKLAVEGSPVLEQVRQLEEIGVQVLVCGTCLNHYGIKNKLAVGGVSNMYEIIETLANAGRIVRP
jgi:selenium metabolism protein YedF